ncbi:hypothetical protein [Fluviicola taffensis]|uniref:hypothetical protein n=1 Tax=Fluviicola taffensis TaxID=191579 RepID=UPI0031384171
MNHLIRLISFILFCVFTNPILAQESGNEYSKISFSIRAKYLYLPGWENVSWRSYSYGGEIFIGKHHAIGIDGDGFITRRRWETGEYDDLIAMEVTKRSSVYADYKYIHPFNEVFSLYGQVYSRFLGKRTDWYEDAENDTLIDPNYLLETKRGTFTDFGIGIGGKWYFNGGNSGLDVSLNAYKRFGSYTETVYSPTNGWSTNDIDNSTVSAYLRVAFFYHFFRFRK